MSVCGRVSLNKVDDKPTPLKLITLTKDRKEAQRGVMMAKNSTCLAYRKCTADIHTLLLVQNVPLVQHKLPLAISDGDESRCTNTPRIAPQLINSTQERYRNIQRETEKGFCVKHTHQCSPSAPLSSLLSLSLSLHLVLPSSSQSCYKG